MDKKYTDAASIMISCIVLDSDGKEKYSGRMEYLKNDILDLIYKSDSTYTYQHGDLGFAIIVFELNNTDIKPFANSDEFIKYFNDNKDSIKVKILLNVLITKSSFDDDQNMRTTYKYRYSINLKCDFIDATKILKDE